MNDINRTDGTEPTPAPTGTPTVGDLDLEQRSSLRRLTRGTADHSTEQSDGYDVEYRRLRLERVVLVGVWTEGTVEQVEARLAELSALAETAGSEVVDMLYQRRDKPDSGTYIGSGKV
ncbi:MAG TPA: GTPase HflX, partial [Corynebacterium variabile]|nr:GTPase HflX [Corynebacterium variabile]